MPNSNTELLDQRLASIEAQMHSLENKLSDLKREYDRVNIAIEVVAGLDTSRPEPTPKALKIKSIPIREHILGLFAHNPEMSVQDVWTGLQDKVPKTGRATVNTILTVLVKKDKLAKRGLGVYCLPQKEETTNRSND